MNFDEFYDALCEETRKSPNDAIGLSVKYYCHLAFQAGAASRDAEIAGLMDDAARYRFLRKFLSSKDLPILTGRGECNEPDEQYAIDCVVDVAIARARKP